MKRHNLKSIFAIFTAIFFTVLFFAQICSALPAFPGAEGFGSETIGGRGGQVFEVTNLNDSGTGSLRAAIEASGPRIIVFNTGGTIILDSSLTIRNPHITIAGQTAPGGGITIKAPGKIGLYIKTHDVLVRYITIRNGSGGATQSILIAENGSTNVYNIIIDHCSLSWATDEVLTTWYSAHDLTMQWNIISEGLDCSTHPKGCHSKGSLLGGYKFSEAGISSGRGAYNLSTHHNLYAHNGERNPMISNCGRNDVRNNVIYNPYWTMMHFYISCLDDWGYNQEVNFIGNYGKNGPDSSSGKYLIKHVEDGGDIVTQVYVKGNLHITRQDDSRSQTDCVYPGSRDYVVGTKFATPAVTTTSATQAYTDVLTDGGAGNSKYVDCSGNWINRRDAHDGRVINDVLSGSAFIGNLGNIIDDESEVGGYLTIATGTPCIDTDHDGMPDLWEKLYGFNPNISSDNVQDPDGDGYTNIEEYLNGTTPKSITSLNTPPEPPKEFHLIYD